MSLLLLLARLATNPALALDWPDLSIPAPPTGDGASDAVVLVAIEDYADVDDVQGARENAEDWLRYFVQTRGVPAARVFKLYDREAKDIKIRDVSRKAAAAVKPGGTLWFVFIGHGAPSQDGTDGMLVGVDADRSADGIYGRSVSRSEVLRLLEAGVQARTMMVLDACFSGQTPSGQALVDGLQPLIPTTAYQPAADGRAVVVTAASSGEFSGPLPGEKRPAFSYLALGALRGWADTESSGNHDGTVSAAELRDYVAGALNLTVKGRSQTPALLGVDAPLGQVADMQNPDLLGLLGERSATARRKAREAAAGDAPTAAPPRAPRGRTPPRSRRPSTRRSRPTWTTRTRSRTPPRARSGL